MSSPVNPLLGQVLHRRRLRRRARQAGAGWVLFGGLHIAVWWAAFNSGGKFGPLGNIGDTDILQLSVWPLLLAASVSFVVMIVYGLRWLYVSGNPDQSDWLEPTQQAGEAGEALDEPAAPARS